MEQVWAHARAMNPLTTASPIRSNGELERYLASGHELRGLRLQGVDLAPHEEALMARTDFDQVVVLGGLTSPRLDEHLRTHGALVFPEDPHAPVDAYRAQLYTPEELYAGIDSDRGYEATPDSLAYEWSQDGSVEHDSYVTLVRAIHDESMSDAYRATVGNKPLVGIMGGHALQRSQAGYAAAARLAHSCAASGLLVATGGGPGAMEAANLGAFCRTHNQLDTLLERIARGPSWREGITAWARLALSLRADVLADDDQQFTVRSVGIPTWFYGHEPPNAFADAVAKFFSNAIREDLLLASANAGVVVLPGAAGTVQEIFQTVTRLYYSPDDDISPLVLVGRDYWTENIPVWPLLERLGRDRAMGQAIHLVDDVDDVLELLVPHASGPEGRSWDDRQP